MICYKAATAQYVAELHRESLTTASGVTRSVVHQHGADLCRRVPVDWVLSVHCRWNAESCGPELVAGRAVDGRALVFRSLLLRTGDAGDEDGTPALRDREFHFRREGWLSDSRPAHGRAAGRLVQRVHGSVDQVYFAGGRRERRSGNRSVHPDRRAL